MTDQVKYKFTVIQTDAETEEIIGGEVYDITKYPIEPFNVDDIVVCANEGEPVMIEAKQINEEATYPKMSISTLIPLKKPVFWRINAK